MDDLTETLREIRKFAYQMWRRLNPNRPVRQVSAGNCCGTSQLVTALLNRRDPGWSTMSGYYKYALNAADAWHCWSQHKNGMIIDLTADQFGDRKIIITNDRDRRYNARGEWSESNEWVRYYDIWAIPRRKRRLSIAQIEQLLEASDKARGDDPRPGYRAQIADPSHPHAKPHGPRSQR